MSRKNRHDLRLEYLAWLGSQIQDERSAVTNSYEDLVSLMFDKEFTYDTPNGVPMDENRLVDGLDLRVEYALQARTSRTSLMNIGPCSFLEVLIGLSRRLAFVAGGDAPEWAMQLMNNLELHRMRDPMSPLKKRRADEIMDKVINRTYFPDGTGGFFPLAWADDDQTRVELWYQLNAYVEEIHPEH